MKERKSFVKGLPGAPRLPYLRGEEGMILVITLVVFLVLSSIAATNIINAYLEKSLARNQHFATISLNAADAGIDYGMSWINENGGTVPDYTVTPTWEQTLGDTLGNGGTFAVSLTFKLDEDDLDGDGDRTDIVIYNRCTGADGCFGFPQSVFDDVTDPAHPVVEIRSEGTYGEAGKREVTLDVARNGFEVKAYGAVTAASNVNTTGTIHVDGRAHAEDGALCPPLGAGSCSCTQAYPGVTVDNGYNVTQGGTADTDGDPTPDSEIGTLPGALAVPVSPDDALGLTEGSLAGMFSGGLPAPGGTKLSGNITYVNDNYTWNVDGTTTGIVIIHNPLFDPYVWKVSIPTVTNPGGGGQIVNPDLDPADPKYDAALNIDYDSSEAPHLQSGAYAGTMRPRNVDQHGNGVFKGVIIADSIDKINGTADVYGAMISLSTIATNILGNGAANVFYSCDAINLYTTQTYNTRISWHRRF